MLGESEQEMGGESRFGELDLAFGGGRWCWAVLLEKRVGFHSPPPPGSDSVWRQDLSLGDGGKPRVPFLACPTIPTHPHALQKQDRAVLSLLMLKALGFAAGEERGLCG